MGEEVLTRVNKADPLMDDELMRADPKKLSVERVGGLFVILKAVEKVLKERVDSVKADIKKRVPPGSVLENDFYRIKHIVQQRKPTLSLEKLKTLAKKFELPEYLVFIVPPVEQREVDLEYLRQHVPADELAACYEDPGKTFQIRQSAKGDLKRRLAEVVR